MSSYMVDDITINKIVAFLSQDGIVTGQFCPLWKIDLYNKDDCRALAKRMFAMNAMAVNQRYGPGEAKEMHPEPFRYRAVMPPGRVEAYKALRCFQYQCCEGDVPETELYKALEWLSREWEYEIVTSLPEYEAAPWG